MRHARSWCALGHGLESFDLRHVRPSAACPALLTATHCGSPRTLSRRRLVRVGRTLRGVKDNVWGGLYEDDAFNRAENVYATSLGAGVTHETILAELEEAAVWALTPDDPAESAERLVDLLAALVAIGWAGMNTFATMVEESRIGGQDAVADPEDVRNTAMLLLTRYAGTLREQLR